MKNIIQIILLLLVCISMAGQPGGTQPAYAVCCKLSDYPIVKKAGYDYIEATVGDFLVPGKSDSAFLVNLAEQKRLDAKIISCIVFLPGNMRVTGADVHHDEIVIWAETTFSRAQKAGISYIVFGSGGARRVPENFGKQKAIEQFVSLCKRLAPIAQKYNVTVVVEPLNTGETNLINSLKEGAEIVEAVNHPNIQLLCDIYHMLRENEPASEIIKYGRFIRHCHIAEKEIRSAPGTQGDDFTSYFNALKQIKYKGCLSIEGKWDNFETRLAPALQYMQQQFQSN
jgi:sugar phosphate isomerase/epimerase